MLGGRGLGRAKGGDCDGWDQRRRDWDGEGEIGGMSTSNPGGGGTVVFTLCMITQRSTARPTQLVPAVRTVRRGQQLSQRNWGAGRVYGRLAGGGVVERWDLGL